MTWQEVINQFLQRFIGRPEDLYPTWPLEEIIRYESTHFLFSCFMG